MRCSRNNKGYTSFRLPGCLQVDRKRARAGPTRAMLLALFGPMLAVLGQCRAKAGRHRAEFGPESAEVGPMLAESGSALGEAGLKSARNWSVPGGIWPNFVDLGPTYANIGRTLVDSMECWSFWTSPQTWACSERKQILPLPKSGQFRSKWPINPRICTALAEQRSEHQM